MLIALWTRNGKMIPGGYVDFLLCKLLGCTPSQLAEEDSDTIYLFLTYYNVEQQIKAANDSKQAPRST